MVNDPIALPFVSAPASAMSASPSSKRLEYARRIFTNRTLRLERIDAVGFDMDYTLAIYTREAEHLAARMALERMVRELGYPEDVLGIGYDEQFAVRGTVIDKKTGNIFKMDAHKHVARVYHGMRRLPKEERRANYRAGAIRLGNRRFALLDTLFELPEAYLFARLVELEEQKSGGRKLRGGRYARLYHDIRHCIDLVHRDFSLKTEILSRPPRYIERDPELPATLAQFREAGKRLFLVTNSEWRYTDAVMRYLLDGCLDAFPTWRHYFEIVVVSARKPGFFTGRGRFERVGEDGTVCDGEVLTFKDGEAYMSGNIRDFERLAGLGGDRVLYIGDHIYGDMLRSKKASAWRTAMVVPEMEEELRHIEQVAPLIRERDHLEREVRRLDSQRTDQRLYVHQLRRLRGSASGMSAAIASAEAELERLGRAIEENLARTRQVLREIDRSFNPYWGMLFKSGSEHSAFGAQVEDYACIYTGRVSNFLAYDPTQFFRTPRDLLPHEQLEHLED